MELRGVKMKNRFPYTIRVLALCLERGWTQREVARMLGVPLPTLNRVIHGSRVTGPVATQLRLRISAILGVDAAWLWAEGGGSVIVHTVCNPREEDARGVCTGFETAEPAVSSAPG
jgi:transcriptional regulator with XRE-family HTH domain